MKKILIEIDLEDLSFKNHNVFNINVENSIYFYSCDNSDKEYIQKCIINNNFHEINSKYTFYTIIKFDKTNKQITIIQDDYGDLKQYYYTYINNKLILCSNLRDILIYLKERKLNNKGLYYFLSCGFIPCENTLIDNIYKVVPGYINIIKIFDRTLELKKREYLGDENTDKFNDNKYKELLKKDMQRQIDTNKECGMTISSGYDSNLLIFLLGNKYRKKAKYYSIGGSKGVDETETARRILNEYGNNNLLISHVDKNTFSSFPEIVYLYEGLFYERGIFLQYELYKMLVDRNENIILGEGADQVMHMYYKNTCNINEEIKKKEHSLYKYCPYEMLIYIVLKKSSLLLGNTSNKLVYPYLSKKFVNYVDKIRNDNGFDKKTHKEIVINSVPKKVSTYLKKIGGATEQIALFENEEEFLTWKNIALNSKFSNIECERNTTELSLDTDYVLKIIYLSLFEKIFCSTDKFILNEDLIKQYNIYDFINNNSAD